MLKGVWGTSGLRLSADSMKDFDACALCLHPAVEPLVWLVNIIHPHPSIHPSIHRARARARVRDYHDPHERNISLFYSLTK
jgi:hypothetical protein